MVSVLLLQYFTPIDVLIFRLKEIISYIIQILFGYYVFMCSE